MTEPVIFSNVGSLTGLTISRARVFYQHFVPNGTVDAKIHGLEGGNAVADFFLEKIVIPAKAGI